MDDKSRNRRYPIGAECVDGGVHFRVWAPRANSVEAAFDDSKQLSLQSEGDGYFSAWTNEAGPETLYKFRLDGGNSYPDPVSRFQPDGPHGPSQVIDQGAFAWSDADWPGCGADGQVIYEMHIGTFTREGTWGSAIRELADLAELGVTMLEVMPVADFPGKFGWGYDGVNMFAPTRLYGSPDDFRRFVDRAHSLGMGVILDVVYNHIGPDGNYLLPFSIDYFTKKYANEWGEAINFDGDNCGPVREFYTTNAAYWIDEYHLDGLRLDATQQIFDSSTDHILTAIHRAVRKAGGTRKTFIVAENEEQKANLVRSPEKGGNGLDALWNDDFHHSAIVSLTGHNDAYYSDHAGRPQEFISAAKYGYLFQGQRYSWQKQARGAPALDLPPQAFVNFIENHDQIANSATGRRIHQLTSPGRLRAMTALFILSPGTPMLFQGQEFGSTAPFFYFADHHPELAKQVDEGRKKFLTQFPTVAMPDVQAGIPDPDDRKTFAKCKLNHNERNPQFVSLHRDLIWLRRSDEVFRSPRPRSVDGAIIGENAFVLRYFGEEEGDRLLVINFGRDLPLTPMPEPLLARREDSPWRMVWSSESPAYGGHGTIPFPDDGEWRIPGESAIVLSSAVNAKGT